MSKSTSARSTMLPLLRFSPWRVKTRLPPTPKEDEDEEGGAEVNREVKNVRRRERRAALGAERTTMAYATSDGHDNDDDDYGNDTDSTLLSWMYRRREIRRRVVTEFSREKIKEEGEGGGNRDYDDREDTVLDGNSPAVAKEEEGEARPNSTEAESEAEAQLTSNMDGDRERRGDNGDDDGNDTDAT